MPGKEPSAKKDGAVSLRRSLQNALEDYHSMRENLMHEVRRFCLMLPLGQGQLW